MKLAPGVSLLQVTGLLPSLSRRRERVFRVSVLVLTFLAYTSYHLSRKPISIVKNSDAFLHCGTNHSAQEHEQHNSTECTSWISAINGKSEKEAKTYLGLLDTSYLFSYAFFMFFSGMLAERMDLRYFLAMGMILSGLFTFMFGLAYAANIHSLAFFISIQIITGAFQASGWPGVVTVMANWFGKGRRGLIMGLWNSHTSLGNILGSLIAGAFVTSNWGLSFIVPGAIIAGVGFFLFLFLVPRPEDIGITHEQAEHRDEEEGETEPLMEDKAEEQTPDASDTTVMQAEERAIGFTGALRIPGVIEFSLCLFFSKLVSYTFLYWLPNYIHQISHVDAQESAILSTIFDIGGIVGGITAGLISDSTGRPASTCSLMLIMAVPCMFLYQWLEGGGCKISSDHGVPVHNTCFTLSILVTLVTGVLVNGPYALITTAVSAELGQHPSLRGSGKALATVTAIIDGTGSVGAAIGPFLAGALSGGGDWSNVFYMLMGADVMALLFLTRLVYQEYRRWSNGRRERHLEHLDYQSINS